VDWVGVVGAAVELAPTADGLPGGAFAQTLLNWLGQVALWASLASMLLGGAPWGLSQQAGNGYQATRGRSLALAGAIGTILAALAPDIVNQLYTGAGG
jgi:hypothetical protein